MTFSTAACAPFSKLVQYPAHVTAPFSTKTTTTKWTSKSLQAIRGRVCITPTREPTPTPNPAQFEWRFHLMRRPASKNTESTGFLVKRISISMASCRKRWKLMSRPYRAAGFGTIGGESFRTHSVLHPFPFETKIRADSLCYSNGDPGWTGAPPSQDNILEISKIEMYYNRTSSTGSC